MKTTLRTTLLILAGFTSVSTAQAQISKVNHVVVIYMENHSFDNLWGQFPGADGLSKAKKEQIIQLDASGQPYEVLGIDMAAVLRGFTCLGHIVNSDALG